MVQHTDLDAKGQERSGETEQGQGLWRTGQGGSFLLDTGLSRTHKAKQDMGWMGK